MNTKEVSAQLLIMMFSVFCMVCSPGHGHYGLQDRKEYAIPSPPHSCGAGRDSLRHRGGKWTILDMASVPPDKRPPRRDHVRTSRNIKVRWYPPSFMSPSPRPLLTLASAQAREEDGWTALLWAAAGATCGWWRCCSTGRTRLWCPTEATPRWCGLPGAEEES